MSKMSELHAAVAQAEALEWAAREAKCSNYIDMSRRCFVRAAELRAEAEKAAADDWQHLKAFGYAPGNYMNKCQACKVVCADLDKRAITCRPCAEKAVAAEKAAEKAAEAQPVAVVLDSQQVRGVMWGVDWKGPVAAGTKLYGHPDPRIAELEGLLREAVAWLHDDAGIKKRIRAALEKP